MVIITPNPPLIDAHQLGFNLEIDKKTITLDLVEYLADNETNFTINDSFMFYSSSLEDLSKSISNLHVSLMMIINEIERKKQEISEEMKRIENQNNNSEIGYELKDFIKISGIDK